MSEQEREDADNRLDYILGINEISQKLIDLELEEKKWKQKYRQRAKVLRETLLLREESDGYVNKIDEQYDELVQANDYYQTYCDKIIVARMTRDQTTTDICRKQEDNEDDFKEQKERYKTLRKAIVDAQILNRKISIEQGYMYQQTQQRLSSTSDDGQNFQEPIIYSGQNHLTSSQLPPATLHNKNPIGNLKRVDLPKFAGNLQDYFQWKSTFDVLVKNNEFLDDNTKYLYLENSLTGAAHRIVENLEHSSTSFHMALSILDRKYGGEERQLQCMYNKIKDIRLAKDYHSLESYYYSLVGINSTLKNHGIQDHQIMHMQLCEKLHSKYMKEYLAYLEKNSREKSLESIMDLVKKKLELS